MTLKDLAKQACADPTGAKAKNLAMHLRFGNGPRFQGQRVIYKHKDILSLFSRASGLTKNEVEDLLL